MGSGYSQEEYERISLLVYEAALREPCLLPDVGIDESLLKYSGLDSNSELQTFSNELLNSMPGYVDRLASTLAPMTSVPNAVGLGALVISMIMEICIKSTSQPNDDSYSMLLRVFGEEKASAVRDTMSTYLWRHQMTMKDKKKLQAEIQRLEHQLSNKLNILKNSLLLDGQMSSRGFKIWVNGASFHIQMLVHEARLDSRRASHYVDSINAAIMLYLQDLNNLLEKYKAYKISTMSTHDAIVSSFSIRVCTVTNSEGNCDHSLSNGFLRLADDGHLFCNPSFWSNTDPKMVETFMNHVYSKYEPITGLKNHFLNIKKNLNSLINQHDVFTLPSIA